MAALKFAETHNLVAFLEKPDESEGFKQIVDFLNAHIIKYALTVNPTIYTSCIEQFWATVKVKTVNGEHQLQALVDGKKIVITESTIIRDLHVEDAKGTKCLPTATIFKELTRMGIVNQQLGVMSHHKKIFVIPSNTKKVFGNMKREGKGFSGTVTPLFPTMMVQAQEEVGEGSEIPTDPQHTPIITQPSTSQPQKKQKPRRKQRKGTKIPLSSGEPTAEEAANEEHVPSHSNNPLLSGEDRLKLNELMELCTTLQSRVLALKHIKTTQALDIESLKRRVKKLEKKKRSRTHGLKRLYKVGLSAKVISSDDEVLGDQEDASKQRRKIQDIDADEDITLENVNNVDMFGVHVLDGDEVFVENVDALAGEKVVESEVVAAKDVNLSVDEVTLAQALATLKSARSTKTPTKTTAAATVTPASTRSRDKGIVFHDQEQASTPTPISSSSQPSQIKDKGKGIMVEDLLQMKKKDQISYDQQEAMRLQAEFDEEARLAREKEEANIVLIEEWDDIQAKIDADHQLAEQLQAQEQEELTKAEKATLFVQLLEKRRKFFAAKRVEEKRNRPPTKAQQRSIMCTYLKNMAGWKPKDLKNKSFATIQDLFDKAMKRVNTFVDMDTELVEGSMKYKAETVQESSSKRAGEDLEQESSKKQKVDEDKESEELKKYLEIVPDDGDDVTIEATPLSIKSPTIVDYKIYKERRKIFFQIIRADGNSQMYLTFTKMPKYFDREDLEFLWRIVKDRFKKT
ncbi:hypothetical protein Tco_0982931 [Tanacetum coccineum]